MGGWVSKSRDRAAIALKSGHRILRLPKTLLMWAIELMSGIFGVKVPRFHYLSKLLENPVLRENLK